MARQINETSETCLIMEIFVEKVYEILVLQQKCFWWINFQSELARQMLTRILQEECQNKKVLTSSIFEDVSSQFLLS